MKALTAMAHADCAKLDKERGEARQANSKIALTCSSSSPVPDQASLRQTAVASLVFWVTLHLFAI